jgi:hypothetical protein
VIQELAGQTKKRSRAQGQKCRGFRRQTTNPLHNSIDNAALGNKNWEIFQAVSKIKIIAPVEIGIFT